MYLLKKEKISEEQNKKLELIATAILIIFAIISFIFSKFIFKRNTNSNNIIIFKNGEEIKEIDGKKIDINNDDTFIIGDLDGEYNIIEIVDHKIHCIDSSCPDKICVEHGFLNQEIDNDFIICAPNSLVIQNR